MLEIVCYKSAERECVGCMLSGNLEAELRSRLAENAASIEFKHKARRSVTMGWPVHIPITAECIKIFAFAHSFVKGSGNHTLLQYLSFSPSFPLT